MQSESCSCLSLWLCSLWLESVKTATQRCKFCSSSPTCTEVTAEIHPSPLPAWEISLDNFPGAAVGARIRNIHNYIWFNFSQCWNWTEILAIRTLEKWRNLIPNPFSVRQVFLKLLLKSLMFSQGIFFFFFFAGKSLRLPETRSHFFSAKAGRQ